MNSEPDRHVVRTCLWRWLSRVGLERFELLRAGEDGFVLRGTVIVLDEGRPVEARYEVLCDRSWHTRQADVTLRGAGAERSLRLTVDAERRWYADGREQAAVRGCVDVDLGWSPSTNTLPIRRLDLATGASSGSLTMAWVRFPQLAVEPLPQQYLRLSDRRYRYTSRGGAFTAEIDVDDQGLVVDYHDFWRREGDVE